MREWAAGGATSSQLSAFTSGYSATFSAAAAGMVSAQPYGCLRPWLCATPSNVSRQGYNQDMVDNALRELVRQLPLEDKAELRSILEDDLAGFVSSELATRLDARWADVVANPDEFVSIEQDEHELRTRRRIA